MLPRLLQGSAFKNTCPEYYCEGFRAYVLTSYVPLLIPVKDYQRNLWTHLYSETLITCCIAPPSNDALQSHTLPKPTAQTAMPIAFLSLTERVPNSDEGIRCRSPLSWHRWRVLDRCSASNVSFADTFETQLCQAFKLDEQGIMWTMPRVFQGLHSWPCNGDTLVLARLLRKRAINEV